MVSRFLLCLFFLPFSASAQEWHDDLDQAKKLAASSQKNILIFFTVADGCETCRLLESRVFNDPEFIAYAEKNFVLVRMDFTPPTNAEDQSENLLIVEKYNKDGFFPWVVVVDHSGKTIGKPGLYENQTASVYLREIQSIIR